MTSKKMLTCFCHGLRTLTVFGTNAIFKTNSTFRTKHNFQLCVYNLFEFAKCSKTVLTFNKSFNLRISVLFVFSKALQTVFGKSLHGLYWRYTQY